MHLTYARLRKNPVTFQAMTGLSIEKFDQLVHLLSPSFEQVESKKLRAGRNSRLSSVSDKLLCGLIYYRTYITHTFLGYLFGLHNSNICRLLKKLEPILAKNITITQDRSLTSDKVLKLLVDVCEEDSTSCKKTKEVLFR